MRALLRKMVIVIAITIVGVAVVYMYTRPHFMMNLADQVWACF